MNQTVFRNTYDGQQPWDPLEVTLSQNESIEAWIKQSGMDWEISESPVHFKPNGIDDFQPYEDKKILYRSDTKMPLSVVGLNYKVVQPREVLEFYRDLTEVSGYVLETAGVIKGGKKIWALARSPQEAILKGNDRVKSYLLLAMEHLQLLQHRLPSELFAVIPWLLLSMVPPVLLKCLIEPSSMLKQ